MINIHELIKHTVLTVAQRILKTRVEGQSKSPLSKPDKISPGEKWFWLHLIGSFTVPFLLILFFAWIGEIHVLSIVSVAILLWLLNQFLGYKAFFEEHDGQVKPIIEALILGSIVGFAKLMGDLAVHFAAGAPPGLADTASFIRTLHTFSWGKEYGLAAVFLVGASLVIDKEPTNKAVAVVENLIKTCGIFDFACNAYILSAGLL